ncbi:hypothetical protein [Gemmatimonas sp.]|uniref:hypothetical protein n=1 Tax=Gemmatimonas sp. TaxID=1962908 RepID=UPI00286C8476|nr:hypothetical protein [Gemmatimonas sp.]
MRPKGKRATPRRSIARPFPSRVRIVFVEPVDVVVRIVFIVVVVVVLVIIIEVVVIIVLIVVVIIIEVDVIILIVVFVEIVVETFVVEIFIVGSQRQNRGGKLLFERVQRRRPELLQHGTILLRVVMVFRARVLRMAERQRGFRDGVNGSIGRRSPWRNPKVRAPYQKIGRTTDEPWRNGPMTNRSRRTHGSAGA